MNLQQLRYVVAVANNGSFREAAKKLYITQPSLSNGIKELESELGLALFFRSNQGATLTTEGKDFLERAEKILVQMDLLENRYRQEESSDRFSIASQHYDFLGSIISQLLERFPAFREYRVMETTTAKVIEEVAERHSEIGLIYMNENNQEELERFLQQVDVAKIDLGLFRSHIFLGKDHPLATKKELSLADLAPYPQVRFNQDGSNFNHFHEDLISDEATPNVVITNDRGTLMNILATSLAYASGSGIVVGQAKDDLRLLPLKDAPVNHLYGIYPNHAKLSEIAEEFFFEVRTLVIKSRKPEA
ncbi:MAG: LysR family transcriptional regulator [Enterococcus sp.]